MKTRRALIEVATRDPMARPLAEEPPSPSVGFIHLDIWPSGECAWVVKFARLMTSRNS